MKNFPRFFLVMKVMVTLITGNKALHALGINSGTFKITAQLN